jgi:hypothetical protein
MEYSRFASIVLVLLLVRVKSSQAYAVFQVGHCHARNSMVTQVMDLDLDGMQVFSFRTDRFASRSRARSENARAPVRSRRTRAKSRS